MWKITGYMDPWNDRQHGPLPRKRWVKVPGERYVLKYRWRAPSPPRAFDGYRPIDEKRGLAYAQWLAARDKIALPTSSKIQYEWNSVDSRTQFRTHHGKPHPRQENRLRAILWGYDEEVYNTRKDGRQGAYLYTRFVTEFRFELPHWDWNPEIPQEEFEEADAG